MSVGAVFSFLAALLTQSSFRLALSAKAWASCVGLIVLGTVLGYGICFTLIQRAGAMFATLVTYVIPVNGLLLRASVLGKSIDPMDVVSLALILSGVLLVRGAPARAHLQSSGDA